MALDYIKRAVLDVLVPNQYGTVLDSSTTHALIEKLCSFNLPTRIIKWIIDFLSNRSQSVRLPEDWLFLVLINDLDVDNLANA